MQSGNIFTDKDLHLLVSLLNVAGSVCVCVCVCARMRVHTGAHMYMDAAFFFFSNSHTEFSEPECSVHIAISTVRIWIARENN